MSNTPTLTKIEIEYGNLGKVMDWCRENCHGDWYITDVSFNSNSTIMSHYEFTFNDEQDVIMFELRWR